MELSLVLLTKMLSMVFWCAAGFIIVKAGLLKTPDSRVLSVLIIHLMTPSLLIRCFQIELTPDRIFGLAGGILFGFAVHIVWILLMRLTAGPLKLSPTDQATLVFTNSGHLIMPLVSMIFGDDYLFYTAGYLVSFNVFIWSYGISLISGVRGINVRKILTNSNIISLIIGIALMLTGIRLPEVLDTSLAGLQGMVGPASMIVIGMVMAGADFRQIITNPKAWMIAAGRLLILPLIIILLLKVSRIFVIAPQLKDPFLISMFAVSAPPASMVTQIAIVYGGDSVSAGTYNVLATCLSLLTMPLMVLVYQSVF